MHRRAPLPIVCKGLTFEKQYHWATIRFRKPFARPIPHRRGSHLDYRCGAGGTIFRRCGRFDHVCGHAHHCRRTGGTDLLQLGLFRLFFVPGGFFTNFRQVGRCLSQPSDLFICHCHIQRRFADGRVVAYHGLAGCLANLSGGWRRRYFCPQLYRLGRHLATRPARQDHVAGKCDLGVGQRGGTNPWGRGSDLPELALDFFYESAPGDAVDVGYRALYARDSNQARECAA